MLQEIQKFIVRTPLVLRYGLLLSVGIVVLKTIEYQFFSFRFSQELYAGLLAIFFLLVGIMAGYGWMSFQRTSAAVRKGPTEPLTASEQRMLAGLRDGFSNQQLADRNHTSVNTVKTHLKNLYRKLQVRNRAEAVAVAKELSLI